MMATSAMAGTFDRWYTPSASNVAAISLSTEFLAPGTTTSPCRGAARRITIRSESIAPSMAHRTTGCAASHQ